MIYLFKFTSYVKETPSSDVESSVSQIISSSAIEFVKTKSGEDEILGTGQFGMVKKAIWTRSRLVGGRVVVAVKCLHHDNNLIEQQTFLDIVNEISAMCNLNHPNLIKLYGCVFNAGNTTNHGQLQQQNGIVTNSPNGIVMMVTELAPHGSLYAYLRKLKLDNKYPPLSQLYSYIFQIGRHFKYR